MLRSAPLKATQAIDSVHNSDRQVPPSPVAKIASARAVQRHTGRRLGLAILAVFATAAHFVAVFGYRWVATQLPRSRYAGFGLRVVYEDGRGILRDVLTQCTQQGFTIARVATHKLERELGGVPGVAVSLEVQGQPRPEALTASLSDLPGVHDVSATDLSDDPE